MTEDKYQQMVDNSNYYDIPPDDEKHYYRQSKPVTIDTWISHAQQNLFTTTTYLEALEHFTGQLDQLLENADDLVALKNGLMALAKEKHELLEFGEKHMCPENFNYNM